MNEQTEATPTVLIVEDNPDSRELAAKVLKAKGFHTVLATDGYEAIRKAAAAPPDVILMDLSLPRLDGYEATRQIKNKAALSNIPIIALTAHAMKGDREKAMAAGCDGYISKPIDVRSLADQIREFLPQAAK